MRILDRYILRQLAPLFGLGVLLFAGIIFFFSPLREALELAQETGISQATMWKLLALRCPTLITYVLPIGALFGCALLSGRMSESGEVTAACMAGVPLRSLMRGAFVFCAAAGIGGAAFNEYAAVPATRHAEEIEDGLMAAKKGKVQRHIRYVEVNDETGKADLLVYADGFDPDKGALMDVTIVWFMPEDPEQEGPSCPRIVRATEARNEGGSEWFVSGAVAWLNPGDPPTRFENQTLSLGRSIDDLKGGRHPERRMGAGELRARAKEMAAEAAVNPNVARVRNSFLMEFWLRIALPMTCLPFAFVGAPLGARPQGGGMSLALGLSVLASFLYYTLLRYADIAGRAGQLSPVVAAWLPGIVALLVGLTLVRRSQH